tara:strand:+ start:408 stop:572 length:165 start_codon:yes stop_codon:yes gene_type:complete
MEYEKNILKCWYSGQIPEEDFYKLLIKNKSLLQLWHETMVKHACKKHEQKKEKQ